MPTYNLMEDAATAEISRAQVWQWLKYGAKMNHGGRVTAELVCHTIAEELAKMKERLGMQSFQSGKFELASKIFDNMMTSPEFPDFMTLLAYEYLDGSPTRP